MTIIIKTVNIDEIKKNNVYTFKPKNSKNILNEHKVVINTHKKCSIQFKLNVKFIHNIKIVVGDNQFKIEKIDYKGVLVNSKVSNKKALEIIFIPDNECSNLNIWDLQIIDYDKLINITWDRINIINLERRSNRKEEMISKMIKENITNYDFIVATDGQDKNVTDQFMQLCKDKKTNIVSVGHFGCLLSHINVIENAKKLGLKSIMVLEDDIVFDKNFLKRINNIRLPEYDILYLSGVIAESKLFIDGWAKHNKIMGAYGYIVNSNMYDIILEKYKEYKYCSDICLIEYIQSKYRVFVLDDIIKTTIETTDTSNKNKTMAKMVNKINSNFYTKL